eukprot:CAMPEP_0196732476 /NCGR_PEP_ID=MMETSP1091-20130531/11876_1 /TAXON_ID=302021 /ORGANISM="Rhodomonas sp., Strain CCMP768" /LENGTH=39 /DNA_ID= /DNA_START= /DNA_END= /DNA_ORIENTATION=
MALSSEKKLSSSRSLIWERSTVQMLVCMSSTRFRSVSSG